MFRPHDQIGSYTLVKRIGKGSFGAVWLAEERTALATHRVALKMLDAEDVDRQAICREASVWETVKGHPNVLPIIKADLAEDYIYIASEYAPDGSLLDWLNKHHGKAPSVAAGVEIAIGILAGLEHLHRKNVVHRDLKPANILMQEDTPRLADFGLARVLKATAQSSNISGTTAFMPPEAFDGKWSTQTDIWATGVILYLLLTGQMPFGKSDATATIAKIIMHDPLPLPVEVPDEICQIVFRALRKNQLERWATAGEMRRALNNCNTRSNRELSPSEPAQSDSRIGGESGVAHIESNRTFQTVNKIVAPLLVAEDRRSSDNGETNVEKNASEQPPNISHANIVYLLPSGFSTTIRVAAVFMIVLSGVVAAWSFAWNSINSTASLSGTQPAAISTELSRQPAVISEQIAKVEENAERLLSNYQPVAPIVPRQLPLMNQRIAAEPEIKIAAPVETVKSAAATEKNSYKRERIVQINPTDPVKLISAKKSDDPLPKPLPAKQKAKREREVSLDDIMDDDDDLNTILND